ncbi:HutD family protein [Peptoniphilus catoniae]|uniref:HutD family protein n=1 Tax=Peptoniphilus catoniae TaxID=1660341 RepID=UPI001FE9A1BB|nr:HutD family protein [Peptoniphilus catoniae]
MRKIERKDFKTSDWAGGQTDEIIINPQGVDFKERNFNYRISSATCNLDSSEFSPYGGFTRFITPLDYELKLIHKGEKVNLKPFEVYKFSGSDQMSSYSKVRDFNLIVKDGLKADLYSKEVKGSLKIKNEAEKLLIFNYNFDLTVNSEEFLKMSLIELDHGESIEIKGEGKLLISEIK